MYQLLKRAFGPAALSAVLSAALSTGAGLCGLLAAAPAQAQCNGSVACGQVPPSGSYHWQQTPTPEESRDACLSHLADMATVMLKASVVNSTALSAAGRANEVIGVAQIKASAPSVAACVKYGTDLYNWITYGNADVSYTSEPAHTLQQMWRFKPEPQMPDAAQFMNLYDTYALSNWCPTAAQSGPAADIGNGPKRLLSPIDHLQACAQSNAPMFSVAASLMAHAKDCARDFEPDALKRYDQEMACMAAAVQKETLPMLTKPVVSSLPSAAVSPAAAGNSLVKKK